MFETGWTLEQVDALSIEQWHEYLQIKDATAKARQLDAQKRS